MRIGTVYSPYRRPPAPDSWRVVSTKELMDIQAELIAITTDRSRSALQADRDACAWSIGQALAGLIVLSARNEEGYHFAAVDLYSYPRWRRE